MPGAITYLREVENQLDKLLGTPLDITAGHLPVLSPLLSRPSVRKVIDSIVGDEKALADIAGRSYTHTLGFRKIVLLDPGVLQADGSRGYGYQLRLHIWQPGADNSVPLIESMHEHSFDFVSHMLLGGMENQCYRFVALTVDEKGVFEKLEKHLATLTASQRADANRYIEAMEAIRLSGLGSEQASREGSSKVLDRRKLLNLLAVSEDDLDLVVAIQGRFQAVSTGIAEGSYSHRLTEMVQLKPHAVLRLQEGDTYFHSHPFAHRLYMRANQPNATMLVTTPVPNALGGSFQRPTWVPDEDVRYERRMYTPDQLRTMLVEFGEQLDAATPATDGRLLDVSAQ